MSEKLIDEGNDLESGGQEETTDDLVGAEPIEDEDDNWNKKDRWNSDAEKPDDPTIVDENSKDDSDDGLDDGLNDGLDDGLDEGLDDVDDEKKVASDPTEVPIDWIELEGALENNSPELHSYLNVVSGDVVRIFQTGENSEIRLQQAQNSEEYLYIDPVSSRDQYRWMEEFIEIVEEPTLKDKLNIAIDGKGAFRRFKDVLVGYPEEREQWFTKRSEKLRTHIEDWLKVKNVVATTPPPWEEGAGEGSAPLENQPPRRPANYENRRGQDNPTDVRISAHEMLDLVPSRELPTALAFLEFLRGRSGYRRGRYG
jgi:Uncharacterised protein family (UPF0158)